MLVGSYGFDVAIHARLCDGDRNRVCRLTDGKFVSSLVQKEKDRGHPWFTLPVQRLLLLP